MLFPGKLKNRRGVSEMIGYVLLITIGIAMSVIVFTWLKGYVPKESVECSEGVSIFIKDYTYDCGTDRLILTLKNNGRFSLSGFLIHSTTEPGQELATKDLSLLSDPDGNWIVEDADGDGTIEQRERSGFVFGGEIKFSKDFPDTNSFIPSTETESIKNEGFIVPDLENRKIDIVVTRYELISEKERIATCTKAKVSQDIACT